MPGRHTRAPLIPPIIPPPSLRDEEAGGAEARYARAAYEARVNPFAEFQKTEAETRVRVSGRQGGVAIWMRLDWAGWEAGLRVYEAFATVRMRLDCAGSGFKSRSTEGAGGTPSLPLGRGGSFMGSHLLPHVSSPGAQHAAP